MRLIVNHRLLLLFVFASLSLQAQKKTPSFTHVEPAFWWTGMKNKTLQILFHHEKNSIGSWSPEINYPGVQVQEVVKTDNPHYLILYINISDAAKPGVMNITFREGKKTITYPYELRTKSATPKGFNSSDVVYLIMPDRFSNGDTSNDTVPGYYEGTHRNNPEGRHGGDLKGIENHIDYLKQLGVTALWINPVLENNQKRTSYHGYAITNLYEVDKRFGGNAAYLSLIEKSHANGIKIIQDMVMNHIGNDHWLVRDLPAKDWLHQFPQFTRSNYQNSVITDPYQSKYDYEKMNNGWFDNTMPDINQNNPHFARYLIQNTLWWIEYAGIDGIRMDTHPYPDKTFMAQWGKEVLEEYPAFNFVGEVWLNSIPTTAYWQKDMPNKDGYNSYLPTVTDFPFCFTVPQALNEKTGWDTGMRKLYGLLAQDFIYPNANHNLTFLDNHDLTRFCRLIGSDLQKFKLGLTFLLTTRGIPQIYYGTELLMDGDAGYHPDIRKDFPGGWKEDKVNAFTRDGRTAAQNEAFDFMSRLLNWRKNATVVHQGKLTHYIPEDNIYIYFRHDANTTVMVILNGNEEEKTLSTAPFANELSSFTNGVDILTNQSITNLQQITLKARTPYVIELKK